MSRMAWLARPWFFAAIGALLLNDHVLKGIWPGWVTGKLSDFAGLAVVSALLAVIFGAGAGTVLAGLGFVALKTVPGVAEMASPLLGGTTLRDVTDLLALLILPLVCRALTKDRPGRPHGSRKVLQVLGLVLAVLATTATSKVEPPTTDLLENIGWSRDGSFYVEVNAVDDDQLHYMRSDDGGASWSASPPPDRLYSSDNGVKGGNMLCADDGVCYRNSTRDLNALPEEYDALTTIERRTPGEEWGTEAVFGDRDFLPGEFAVNLTNSNQVVAMSRDGRILQRAGYGVYLTVNVLAYFRAKR